MTDADRKRGLTDGQPLLEVFEHVFPVFGGRSAGRPDIDVEKLCGTAFSIGGGLFLTAGHVLECAQAYPRFAVGVAEEGGHWRIASLEDSELFAGFDVACFAARIPSARTLSWRREELPMLHPVQTCGYPHGLIDEAVVVARGFQGHIVSGRPWSRLPGRPHIYELSFPCPLGLSGAPLWTPQAAAGIVGMILGNEIVEMTVYSETEIDREKGSERSLLKLATLHLGIAIQASSLFGLNSRLLGGTVGDWLARQELLGSNEPEEGKADAPSSDGI